MTLKTKKECCCGVWILSVCPLLFVSWLNAFVQNRNKPRFIFCFSLFPLCFKASVCFPLESNGDFLLSCMITDLHLCASHPHAFQGICPLLVSKVSSSFHLHSSLSVGLYSSCLLQPDLLRVICTCAACSGGSSVKLISDQYSPLSPLSGWR